MGGSGNRHTSLPELEEKEEVEICLELVRQEVRKLAGVTMDQVTFNVSCKNKSINLIS